MALGLGGVTLGAGVYAQWLRDEPLPYALWLLLGGAVAAGASVLFGPAVGKALRVGDLGVGLGRSGGGVDRVPWYRVTAVELKGGTLRLETDDQPLAVALDQHPAAAAYLVAQARKRIPERVRLDEAALARVGEPDDRAGQALAADPPQVTGQRCHATDQPLQFEKDVRICARCGALYHRASVPERCVGCEGPLR